MVHNVLGLLFLVLVILPNTIWAQQGTAPLEIYLAIGQSNMAGRAEVPSGLSGEIPGVYLFTGSDMNPWLPAKNPLNLYSTIRKEESMQRLSPAYAFARYVAKKSTARVGLVVNARGGSALSEWMPGTSFYQDIVMRARQAMEYGTIKGVIWHQGESDVARADVYITQFAEFINALRQDLGLPNLPVVVGQLAPGNSDRESFNRILVQMPDQISNSSVVSSKSTTTFDDVHFDTKSQLKLGKRYGKRMVKLTKQTK